MQVRIWIALGFASTAWVAACVTSVPATNPYDPAMPAEQQQKASLRGVVLGDRHNGSPVEALVGAEVALDGPTNPENNPATTGEDGAFAFDTLTPGRYTLDVSHTQFLRQVRELTLTPGEERNLQVIMDAGVNAAEEAHITGEALKSAELSWPAEEQDHSGIMVEVDGYGIRTVTNQSGRFDLRLAAGTYDLVLSSSSHVTTRRDDVVAPAGVVTTVPDSPIVLAANPGSISGIVELEDRGDGQHGDALISVLGGPTTVSAPDGTFRVNNVAPGTHTLTVSKTGFDTATILGLAVLGGRDTIAPAFVLRVSRGSITGLVELAGSTDHSGVTVSLAGTTHAVSSTAAGSFSFEGIRVGTYQVVATRRGYRRAVANGVEVTSGGMTSLSAPLILVTQQGDFEINDGESFTNNQLVTLSLAVSDAAFMRIVGDVAVPDPDFSRPYVTNPQVTLVSGDGLKTVEVYYQDAGGVESGPFSASIILDTAPPNIAAVEIDGGAAYTRELSGLVQLRLTAGDELSGVVEMQLSLDTVFDEPWVAFVTPKIFQLGTPPIADGPKTVYVRFKDGAGNMTPTTPTPSSATIFLDRQEPTLNDFSITCNGENPAGRCSSPIVDLIVDATGADFMALSNQAGVPVESWVPWGPAQVYLVPPGDGPKWIYVKLMDLAGNKSTDTSAFFTLDMTAPAGTVSINAGAARTGNATVALTGTASEPVLYSWGSDSADCLTGTFTSTLSTIIDTPTATLLDEEGTRTLEVCLRDEAGNRHLVRDTIMLDKTGPGGQMLVEGGASHTRQNPATATFANFATDVSKAYLTTSALASCSAVSEPAWIPFSLSLPVALSGGDGPKSVSACLRDDVGNTTLLAAVGITLDTTLPSWSTPTLEAKARTGYTTSSGTDLIPDGGSTTDPLPGIKWDGATDLHGSPLTYLVQFSSSAAFSSPELVGPGPRPPAELGQGTWYYRVVAIDKAGNSAPGPSQSLSVDLEPPLQPTIIGLPDYARTTFTVQWSPGSADTNSYRFVLLRHDAVPPTEVLNVVTSATSRALAAAQLPPSAGMSYTVKVVPIDLLGNEGFPATGSFVFDSQAPCETATPTLSLNSGATWTSEPTVTVTVTCPGATPSHMRVSCNGSVTGSEELVPYAPIFVCVLSSGDGVKTVDTALYDLAGNTRSLTEVTINFDGTPPGSPTLTPGNTVAANYACAHIQVPVGTTVDANFLRYEMRTNGGPFVSASSFVDGNGNTKISFSLAQDTDNLLEVRAVDRAGNVGQPSIAYVQEVSSALLPTALTVKQVCDVGEFAILKDMNAWPPVFQRLGSSPVAPSLSRQVEVGLLDIDTLTITRFNGTGGYVTLLNSLSGHGSEPYSNTWDAACNPLDGWVMFPYLEASKVFVQVWDSPLTNPGATGTLNPTNTDVKDSSSNPVTIASIDAYFYNGLSSQAQIVEYRDPDGFGAREYLRTIDFTVHVPATVRNPHATISDYAWGQRVLWGLGFSGNNAFWLQYNGGNTWEVMRSTGITSPTSVTIYSSGDGFTNALSPWGSRTKMAVYAHGGYNPYELLLYTNNVGVPRYRRASSPTGLSSLGSNGYRYAAHYDSGVDTVAWVDQYQANRFRLNQDYSVASYQDYRHPIDNKAPMFPTGRSGPGEAIVLYHTPGGEGPRGVVVGYQNLPGCRVPPAGVHPAEIAHGHVRSGGGGSGGLGVG